MNRRTAIETLAVSGIAAGQTASNSMPYRTLGKTERKYPRSGSAAITLATRPIPIWRSASFAAPSIAASTFMDNCWDYHDGESEQRMGAALRDGYRQKVFLMTKFDGRTKKSDGAGRSMNRCSACRPITST